ncbi:TetR/AcrR family transcriptional regulator [Pantoea piersonii]|uniref:TetR/AcrR family transcriptional regulator n=1 Tax=Pantoea piersonii TaxID=2364647 RepID=UPI002FD9738C
MKNDLKSSSRRSSGAVRSEQSHVAILEAAKLLLTEKGYAGFSIEAVAKLAGASKPTIYRWWPNKAQLIAEVYEVETKKAISIPEGENVCQRLVLLLEALWDLWRNTICGVAFRSFIAECQNNSENMALLREEFMARRFALPAEILKSAIEKGELPADTDVELILVTLFGFCWFQLLTDSLSSTHLITPFIYNLMERAPVKNKHPQR